MRPAALAIHPLDPVHRDRLVAFTRATGFFNEAEVAVAEEVIDDTLVDAGYGYLGIEAWVDQAPAGYAIYAKVPLTDATWDVYWIVVDPAFQRKGVGRALLSAIEADVRARGGRWILIETAGKSLYRPTHAFYTESGYREVSRIDDFYAPGDARIIFGKRP